MSFLPDDRVGHRCPCFTRSWSVDKAYEECLFYKVVSSGFYAEKQKPMPLTHAGVHLECGYRVDILVEKKLVLEIKAVEGIHDVFVAQVLTYLRLGDFKLGLIINFNKIVLMHGIRRVIHGTL
jgi:GxxExxY protein